MTRKVLTFMLVGLLVMTLGGVFGCCESPPLPDGSTTKSFYNCLTNLQDKICNAPDDVVSVADIVIQLLKPVAMGLVPGSAPYVALVTAQGIKSTGCAAVTDLNIMIAYIQGLNQAKTMQASGTKAMPQLIDVNALVLWRAMK